jgi:hypothetical protein
MDSFGHSLFRSTQHDRPRVDSRREPDLFESVGRLVGEIEALKQEREADLARTARLRLGAVHAKARLEKRVSEQ